MTHSFSINEAFRVGWEKTKAHSALLFEVMLTLFAVQVVSAIVTRTLHGTLIGGLASIAIILTALFIGVGFTIITLHIAEGKHVHYADIFPNWLVVLKYMCANILAAIVMFVPLAVGFIISLALGFMSLASVVSFSNNTAGMNFGAGNAAGLVVAALVALAAIVCSGYLALRYSFVRYAVLDNAGITESLTKSALYSRGNKWKLLFFVILVVLFNIVGAVLLLVGLLVTLPISMVAIAHVYVKLKGHHHAH